MEESVICNLCVLSFVSFNFSGRYFVNEAEGSRILQEFQKSFQPEFRSKKFPKITILAFLGLAYKRKVGGSHEKLKEEFPGLEQQIQLNDVMENEKIQEFFRQHFRAFLHYLEETEPALTNHTGYMKKMHKHILKGTGYFLSKVLILFFHQLTQSTTSDFF